MLQRSIQKLCLFLILFFFLPGAAYPGILEVHLVADRFSLWAEQVPLQDILKRLAEHGISVRIDPHINPVVSASFKDREMRDGLESILKSLNHVLIWESVPGPEDAISVLAEIQVFRPGQKAYMQPLEPGSALSLGTDPKNGSLFVKNELLVMLKPGLGLAGFQKLIAQSRNPNAGIQEVYNALHAKTGP